MSIIFFLFYNPLCVPWISIRGMSRLVFVSDVGGDACGGVRLCDQPETSITALSTGHPYQNETQDHTHNYEEEEGEKQHQRKTLAAHESKRYERDLPCVVRAHIRRSRQCTSKARRVFFLWISFLQKVREEIELDGAHGQWNVSCLRVYHPCA